jgi:dienelactone hydrolase
MLALLAAGLLDLPSKPYEAQTVSTEPHSSYEERVINFPSAVQSLFPNNNTVWAHYLVPKGEGKRPCILVLPVMAAPNIWIETRFIKKFLAQGFAVLWLEMPYQFHRRPDPSQPSGQVFLARNPQKLAQNFRQSALDARRALDWLSRQPEIDPARVGIFGVSLGALVSSVVYSVDPRPKYAVFLLGGADFPSLVFASSMTGPYVKQLGVDQATLRAAFKGLDPLEYRDKNAEKPAYLINVRSDTVIPGANADKLREAFPKSAQKWLPLGHYTAILHLLWIPGHVAARFKQNL